MVQSMVYDPKKVERALRVYRGVKTAGKAAETFNRVKGMLDERLDQADSALDFEEFSRRVREKRVRSEDVRYAGRMAMNAAPHVYRYVAKHIQKSKAAKDA